MAKLLAPRLPRPGSAKRTALELAVKRSFGWERPAGKYDRAGRWYPSKQEQAGCCDNVRSPSNQWPSSAFKHCWTLRHVANRFGVDEAELRRLVKTHRLAVVKRWIPTLSLPELVQLARVCDQEVLRLLRGHPNSDIRQIVAERTTNAADLEDFLHDLDDVVKKAASNNPHLPEHLRMLARLASL